MTTKNLGDLQAMFAEALASPKSIAREGEWPTRGEASFTGSARLSPIEQLDVYREQFWLRHVACLAEDFPTLQAFVGEARFEAIVAGYLAAHPPVHFMLRHLGSDLARFLEASNDESLVVDIARVEWAFVEAFDAADAPPLDARAVAEIPEDAWSTARIILHPSLQRLRLAHPTHTMRAQHREKVPVVRPEEAATRVVVYRRDFLLYAEEMEALPFDMLERLAGGQPLGEAGDALADATGRREEVESRIGEWFTRWSALGWITRVDVSV
jgi:hypothetical protein